MVAIGAVALGLIILVGGILLPLQSAVSRAMAGTETRRDDLAWMQANAAEIRARGAEIPADTGEAPVVLVDRVGREAGLGAALRGTQPNTTGGVRVQLEARSLRHAGHLARNPGPALRTCHRIYHRRSNSLPGSGQCQHLVQPAATLARGSARRWPLILLGLLVLAAAVVYLLPASMVSRFLPVQIRAEDFSGSLLHGAAGRIVVNGRDAGAIEWQIHPLELLRLAVVADVHWVKVGFVIDGTAEIRTAA